MEQSGARQGKKKKGRKQIGVTGNEGQVPTSEPGAGIGCLSSQRGQELLASPLMCDTGTGGREGGTSVPEPQRGPSRRGDPRLRGDSRSPTCPQNPGATAVGKSRQDHRVPIPTLSPRAPRPGFPWTPAGMGTPKAPILTALSMEKFLPVSDPTLPVLGAVPCPAGGWDVPVTFPSKARICFSKPGIPGCQKLDVRRAAGENRRGWGR